MAKTFYSKETVFNPEYRNVQAELWTRLSEEQQKVVASVFCHLKNHAQIEIAEALIDYIEADIHPQASDWSDTTIGSMFYMLVFRLFGKDLTEGFKNPASAPVDSESVGFKKTLSRFTSKFKKA